MVRVSTRHLSLIAVFAALYYALSIVSPFIPAIGLPQIKIQLEAAIASIFGLVLGPYLGFMAGLGGAFVAWVLPPGSMSPYGMPFLLSPAFNALVVGLMYFRKWKHAFAALGLLIVAFLFLPPSQPFGEFWYVGVAVIWDKIIALLLILPSVKFSQHFTSRRSRAILYFLLAFIGNQADNMWGADIFAVPVVYNGIFQIPTEFVRGLFTVSPFIYPAIRLIQAVFVAIIAIPLLPALRNTNWVFEEKAIVD